MCQEKKEEEDFPELKIMWMSQYDDSNIILSSQLGVENTPTASLQRGKTPLTSVLDMRLNNLMLRPEKSYTITCGIFYEF